MATKDLTIAERELIDGSLEFIKSLAIKNPYMVQKNETEESAKWAETYLFILDNKEEVSFEYFTYNEDDLRNVGITDEELLKLLSEDNRYIPDEYRDRLLEHKISYYEEDYVEYNNYYRMLNGQPNIEDDETDYIYVTVKDSTTKEIVRKPIHTLTDNEFYQIEIDGRYKQILSENPTLQYLYYIQPSTKVSYYTARKTKDFYIMGYNNAILEEEYSKQIIDLYYEILVYTMSVVYTSSFRQNEYYDSYIILYMLMATLQKFFAKNIENLMRRDVYDLEAVRNIYASYGLPFFEEIPLKFQKKIVKNINRLLAYKGTEQIFVDLADIFGFNDTELYKYYLVKDYKRDASGQPISYDDTDPENVDLKFAQVSTSANDISSFLKKDYLYQSYEDVVNDDPYWGQKDTGEVDEDLKNEIKEMEFNYVASKYLSVTTVFNMSECAFETVYFFNYMNKLFKEGQIDRLQFFNTEIKNNGEPISLFSAITALYILLFRRFGYLDTLPSTVTGIASVYGFNFDGDLQCLKDYMERNSYVGIEGQKANYLSRKTKIEELIKVLDLPNNPDKAKILNTFFEDKDFDKEIEEMMLKTEDYRIFRALNALHTYNMYSNSIKDLYGSDYGTTESYSTFTDWLQDNDILMYKWVQDNSIDLEGNINKEGTIKALDDLLDSLDMYFYSDQFTNLFTNMNITIDLIRKYFIQMVSIFKAYTVELKKVNIYYLFNDKFLNTIKLFSEMRRIITLSKADSAERHFAEELLYTIKLMMNDYDMAHMEEYVMMIAILFKKDTIHLDYYKLIKEAILNYAESIERNFSEDINLGATWSINDKDMLERLEDYLIRISILSKQDNIDISDLHGYIVEVLSSLADSIEKNISEDITKETTLKYYNNYLAEKIEEFTTAIANNSKKDDIIMRIKNIKDTKSKYADGIRLVDTENIRSANVVYNDLNKIINGQETLEISYSYV